MNANRTNNLLLFSLILFSIAIWNCAGKPFDPPRTGEIPDGPGVFSKGEDGMVLYDSDKGGLLLPVKKETEAPPSAEAAAGEPNPSDHKEFEDYQQWLEWKKTAVGTPAYKEFQQWLQWRQYQKWKQRQ
jgi:hypothetical protein